MLMQPQALRMVYQYSYRKHPANAYSEAKWILIDQSGFQTMCFGRRLNDCHIDKPLNMLETEALKYSGQLMAYKRGVQEATGKKVLSSWIHFPVSGMMMNIVLD